MFSMNELVAIQEALTHRLDAHGRWYLLKNEADYQRALSTVKAIVERIRYAETRINPLPIEDDGAQSMPQWRQRTYVEELKSRLRDAAGRDEHPRTPTVWLHNEALARIEKLEEALDIIAERRDSLEGIYRTAEQYREGK